MLMVVVGLLCMEKVKVLLADPDTRFMELAGKFLNNFPDIEVIACKDDGNDALACIRTSHPDAVLFDLVLPGLDGISLLRKVNILPGAPVMICCTRFYSEVAMEAMRTFGASYLLYKPVELQSLHPAIHTCVNLHRKIRKLHREIAEMEETDIHVNAYIRNYIVSLGIPSKLIGCTYLTEAVRLARHDDMLVRNLSKGLYLEMARGMNTTPARIERCIRNAINVAFQTGGLDARLPGCPSNKEFINFVIHNIDL